MQLHPHQHVLELGCGNAGLLRFIAECLGPEGTPQLQGVDQADLDASILQISRLNSALRSRIEVLPNIDFKCLPHAKGSVDVVLSQFAIEYAADEVFWAELQRILAPSARLALILHKRDSLLDRVAKDDLLVCDGVLMADGVLDQANMLLPYAFKARTAEGKLQLQNDDTANTVRRRFNQSCQQLQDSVAGLVHKDLCEAVLGQIVTVLAQSTDRACGLDDLARIRTDLEDQQLRLRALRKVALDPAALKAFIQRLQSLGFTALQCGEIKEKGHEFGWSIEAIRTHHG